MRLNRIHYEERIGSDQQWSLESLALRNVNLIVGKNSSGKSRTLNLVNGLAKLLLGTPNVNISNCSYNAEFSDGDSSLKYELIFGDRVVVREFLWKDGKALLQRQDGGAGEIFAEQEGKYLKFQSPETHLAVVSRQDSIQHSYLESLVNWAEGVYHYPFGTPLGQTNLIILQPNGPMVDAHDANQAIGVFREGTKQFGDEFKESIISDMGRMGYNLNDVGTAFPTQVVIEPPLDTLQALYVREAELSSRTEQFSMSQGMFRALATLIHLNYGLFTKKSECILIDDIGEGLDFERSCALINIVVEKATASDVQIVATTNDRFVMNSVDLKHWTVLTRKGSKVISLDAENSPEVFKNFRFTGLNNFDFFANEYFKSSPLA